MKMKAFFKVFLTGLFSLIVFYGTSAMADHTTVLPEGRSAITAGYLTADIEDEYDDSSDKQDLGYYLDGTDVTVIGEGVIYLGLLDAGFPPGVLSPSDILRYARTTLDAKAEVDALGLGYSYGITDKLTVGLVLPFYMNAETEFDFDVEVQPSNTAAYIPVAPGVSLADYINSLDARQVTQEYLQQELGYDEVEDWKGQGRIGDLELNLKYLFLNKDKFKAATGGWVKFPTGRKDDERNLTDIAYGSGNWDTALFAMTDIVPVKPLTLNLTGRYIWAWPYERGIFILDKDQPQFYEAEFPTKHVNGEYDIGDWYELETELKFDVTKYLELSGGYFYMASESSRIDGDLIPESVRNMGKYFYGITFNTVNFYREDKFKVPMYLSFDVETIDQGRSVEKPDTYLLTAIIIF
jgi:hypothetical protein